MSLSKSCRSHHRPCDLESTAIEYYGILERPVLSENHSREVSAVTWYLRTPACDLVLEIASWSLSEMDLVISKTLTAPGPLRPPNSFAGAVSSLSDVQGVVWRTQGCLCSNQRAIMRRNQTSLHVAGRGRSPFRVIQTLLKICLGLGQA